jgi:hypothetical protein
MMMLLASTMKEGKTSLALASAGGTDRDFPGRSFEKLHSNKPHNVVQVFTGFEIKTIHNL